MATKATAKPTVFVGMSGGVDSSVSAALLKKQGYNVVGVFIKAWEPAGWDCGWREDRRDAMRVAAILGIPFLTLDLSCEYKQEVVDYMIAEYKSGRTPNPDVMCNKSIKFGAFFRRAKQAGADYIATGHYAQVRALKTKSSSRYELLAGADKNKDQSYFLWTLTQAELAHTLFPIGHLEKHEVRKLAASFKLPNSQKKDSQGLCFIGKLDIKDFLSEFIETKEGSVLDKEGNIIGKHKGALLYTLGERHGFDVFKKSPTEPPLYIVSKDLAANTVTVEPESKTDRPGAKSIILAQTNWIAGEPQPEKKYRGRIRYREPLRDCTVKITKEGAAIAFASAPSFPAAGQSCVIYAKDGTCLGGGVIA